MTEVTEGERDDRGIKREEEENIDEIEEREKKKK